MRLTSIELEEGTSFPRYIAIPGTGPFVVHAPSGPVTANLFEAIAAAKERIGPYGVGGAALWAGRPRLALTLGLALTEEEIEFAAADGPKVEVSCAIGGADGPGITHASPGTVALLKRALKGRGAFELVVAERSLVGNPPGGGIPGRVADMLRLSTHVKKYAGLTRLLIDAARDKSPAFETFKGAFDTLSPATKCVGLSRRNATPELLFQRGHAAIPFSDLGLDEHQYVLFAGLRALRGFAHSVLLVDAPELHLSQERARDLVLTLVELFGPDNQILFGTRSHQVAAAFPASQVLRVE